MPYTTSLVAQQVPQEGSDNAYASLDDAGARKLVKGCTLPRVISGPGDSGSQIILRFTVSEKGKLLSVHRVQGAFTHQLAAGFADCHFTPYKLNDKATAFQADIVIEVK